MLQTEDSVDARDAVYTAGLISDQTVVTKNDRFYGALCRQALLYKKAPVAFGYKLKVTSFLRSPKPNPQVCAALMKIRMHFGDIFC